MTMKNLRTSKKFRIYKEVRRELTTLYPRAFPRLGRRPVLRVGILDDIRSCPARALSMNKYRVFLRIWTNSTAYLKAVAPMEPRVSLDGSHDGSVDRRHAVEARAQLAARKSKTSN
jgi:sRNA-binding protein